MKESPHRKLAEQLDSYMMGIPKRAGDFSPAFLDYLEMLYTPEEAALASCIAVEPGRSTLEQVAEDAGSPVDQVEKILERMVAKRTIFGVGGLYVLPPMPVLVNLHQFHDDVDPDTLKANNLYQDFFVEDGFYRFYQSSAEGTLRRRTVPVDQSISADQQVLLHEELASFLDNATGGAMALVP
jgi:hypothetical protein